jgi:folate-binding protein YgfZ
MTAEDTTRCYLAARRGTAWLDRSAEGVIEVRGADRISWLQGLLTNDIAALAPGRGCYAAYLTPQGRMITDLRVLVRDDCCWIALPARVGDAVLQRFEMFVITEDVTLSDLSGKVARLAVHGPTSASVVARALALDTAGEAALLTIAEHGHVRLAAPFGSAVVVRSAELGGMGFDVYVDVAARSEIVGALDRAGAEAMDEATWHVCRIEAARPAFGLDMDEDTIPLEAGIEDRAISFTKGCYVGQEVVIRVRDRGHGRVARRLMTVVADAPPDEGTVMERGDSLVVDGKDVGRITSAAVSPALARSVALGYVGREHAVAGSPLAVRHGAALIPVTLATGPVVDVAAPARAGVPGTRG